MAQERCSWEHAQPVSMHALFPLFPPTFSLHETHQPCRCYSTLCQCVRSRSRHRRCTAGPGCTCHPHRPCSTPCLRPGKHVQSVSWGVRACIPCASSPFKILGSRSTATAQPLQQSPHNLQIMLSPSVPHAWQVESAPQARPEAHLLPLVQHGMPAGQAARGSSGRTCQQVVSLTCSM